MISQGSVVTHVLDGLTIISSSC